MKFETAPSPIYGQFRISADLGAREYIIIASTLYTTIILLTALPAWAADGGGDAMNLNGSAMGILALVLFVAAYGLVIFEEHLHLRKSIAAHLLLNAQYFTT